MPINCADISCQAQNTFYQNQSTSTNKIKENYFRFVLYVLQIILERRNGRIQSRKTIVIKIECIYEYVRIRR